MNPTSRRQLASIELGETVQGTFAWRQGVDRVKGIPCGIMLLHPHPDGGKRHTMLALWADLELPPGAGATALQQERVTLETLKPLTIVESLRCDQCRLVGRIVENRWVPDGSD